NPDLSLEDLIEEGNLGLLKAVERYDLSRGCRFSTYAVFWIKQSIRRTLANSGRTIRLPAYLADLLRQWQPAVTQLHSEWRQQLGVTRERVRQIEKQALDKLRHVARVAV